MKISYLKKICMVFSALLFLNACAGVLPVPGGSETINPSFYESDEDMKERVQSVRAGMPKDTVFSILNRDEDDFIMLNRPEIMSTLYGGQRLEFVQNTTNPLNERHFLQSLSGYKLLFKSVDRKHGISSPVTMRTNESGFTYTATFIFQDGVLYEDPVLSGGVIDTSSSTTVFDYMSPKTFMTAAGI